MLLMSEVLTKDSLHKISNDAERLFATAMMIAFPAIKIYPQVEIGAKSGNRSRATSADFKLVNGQQELFIEVTEGKKSTKRKRRQRKTARLAGKGEQYLVVDGEDLEQIAATPPDRIRTVLISVLKGRYNASLFNFNQ